MIHFKTLTDDTLFKKAFSDGKSWHTPYHVCFYLPGEECRVGFIASKKVGNAVKRSRAKRRLRALVGEIESSLLPGIYIFIAKGAIIEEEYIKLKEAFTFSLKRLNTIKR